MTVPRFVTEQTITPAWLNARLKTDTIESIRVERIGQNTGHTDDVYRVHLSHNNHAYAKVPPQPTTVVVKVLDATTGHRTAFAPLNKREVLFYKEIAPLLDLDSIPKCYSADFDETLLRGNLVLEDAGRAIHNGELDTATPEQAKLAMTELGKLHGKSIITASTSFEDLKRPLEPQAAEMRRAFPAFAETWGQYLGDAGIKRYMSAVNAYEDKWLLQRDGFLQGFVHGDYRIGNVIFGSQVTGPENDTERHAIEDFAPNVRASIARRHDAVSNGPVQDMSVKHATEGDSPPATQAAATEAAMILCDAGADYSQHEEHASPENKTTGENGSSSIESTSNLASGTCDSPLTFKHIDWQTVSRGPVFLDVAYFLAISLESRVRRAWEVELLSTWYTACREAAGNAFPANLGLASCVHQVKISCIVAVVISVINLSSVRMPETAMRMLAGKLNDLSLVLDDWGSLA